MLSLRSPIAAASLAALLLIPTPAQADERRDKALLDAISTVVAGVDRDKRSGELTMKPTGETGQKKIAKALGEVELLARPAKPKQVKSRNVTTLKDLDAHMWWKLTSKKHKAGQFRIVAYTAAAKGSDLPYGPPLLLISSKVDKEIKSAYVDMVKVSTARGYTMAGEGTYAYDSGGNVWTFTFDKKRTTNERECFTAITSWFAGAPATEPFRKPELWVNDGAAYLASVEDFSAENFEYRILAGLLARQEVKPLRTDIWDLMVDAYARQTGVRQVNIDGRSRKSIEKHAKNIKAKGHKVNGDPVTGKEGKLIAKSMGEIDKNINDFLFRFGNSHPLGKALDKAAKRCSTSE